MIIVVELTPATTVKVLWGTLHCQSDNHIRDVNTLCPEKDKMFFCNISYKTSAIVLKPGVWFRE